MFHTHSVFIIVLVIEYLLLLMLYRVYWCRDFKLWLLDLSRLIEKLSIQQQLLPLPHLLLWNQTGHNSKR